MGCRAHPRVGNAEEAVWGNPLPGVGWPGALPVAPAVGGGYDMAERLVCWLGRVFPSLTCGQTHSDGCLKCPISSTRIGGHCCQRGADVTLSARHVACREGRTTAVPYGCPLTCARLRFPGFNSQKLGVGKSLGGWSVVRLGSIEPVLPPLARLSRVCRVSVACQSLVS